MADIADYANDLMQMQIENSLRNRIPEKAIYYKVCRYCKEPTPDGGAFCDDDCRDDFERLKKYGANNT